MQLGDYVNAVKLYHSILAFFKWPAENLDEVYFFDGVDTVKNEILYSLMIKDLIEFFGRFFIVLKFKDLVN